MDKQWFQETPGTLPSPSPKKLKKNPYPQKFLIFREMKLFALILKKILYFLKRKLFLYFLKKSFFLHFINKKLFLYFLKWRPALFTPNSKNKRNPPRENFLYFRKRKPRKISCVFLKECFCYISGNGNPETETLKELLIFLGITCKAWKTNKKVCFEEISCILWHSYNLYISKAYGHSLWSKK